MRRPTLIISIVTLALAAIGLALVHDPAHRLAGLFRLPAIEEREAQPVDEIAQAAQAIRANPRDPMAWFARANAYKEKGELDRALKDYDKAIRLNRGVAAVYAQRASTRRRMGDLDRAIADYTRATELEPMDAQVWFKKSHALFRAGDRKSVV